MRNTRQGTYAPEEGDNITIQQLMEIICALQQTVAVSKVDQDMILAEVQVEQTDIDSRSIWTHHEQTSKNCTRPMRNYAENCKAWGSLQQGSKPRP